MSRLVPCCPPVLRAPLAKADAASLATAFRALADPGRLRLLSFIAAQPEGEACVCHLTGAVELAQPTVTHHLQVLNRAGLLEREKRGAWVYYRVVPERLREVAATLAPGRRPARRRVAGRRCA